ncbi:MAG: hypothetical protein V7L14_11995 [Nostoc sp.]|uniref:hypothetical protein n=1 Tax=Nostoc sp. TaxID=1180 RepID=UPI002FF8EDD7
MLDEVTSLEDVHKLAGDEDVETWQGVSANYLINVKDEIFRTFSGVKSSFSAIVKLMSIEVASNQGTKPLTTSESVWKNE